MPKVTIYHNPRCTKSRQTLALLTERGIEPQVVEYLVDPPDAKALAGLVKKLGLQPAQLVRRKEFNELGLPATDDPQTLIELMAKHPQIIERPIVVCGAKAALGRPPENVLAIL
ncbi:MAG: arsenate reductase (glutaredoxin) [Planctomycetales bacterium]|nr:arsenate reductase (glutaredoxin) [Planctomycetales bacterium]